MNKSDMKKISIPTALLAIVLLQNGRLAAQESNSLPLMLQPSILQRGGQRCPSNGLLEAARADLKSQVQNLIHTFLIEPRERVCGCGDAAAGWTRVAFLNMTDTNHSCPGDWTLVSSPKRTCGRPTNLIGCSSATFSSGGVTYSRVCGRIIGYQLGTTDAFWQVINRDITADGPGSILDGGVTISHGSNPRQHIWTLASGYSQQRGDSFGCPCNIGNDQGQNLPLWLGQDYFCDSAPISNSEHGVFYADNPLWDGVGCDESSTTCCEFNNPPWFCKQLPQSTSDDIELRLCADDLHIREDTPIELVEIYIR